MFHVKQTELSFINGNSLAGSIFIPIFAISKDKLLTIK